MLRWFVGGRNPTYISPTDNLMTPCTQKLSAAKKKHFAKLVQSLFCSSCSQMRFRGAKPIQLFAQAEEKAADSDDENSMVQDQNLSLPQPTVDAENPF